MTRLSKIAAALIVAVGACSAHAFDIYAGGSLGLTKFHSDGLTDTSDTGLKLFAGTPITPMFGIEGGYVDLGKAKDGSVSVTASGLYVDALIHGEVAPKMSLFGKVGTFLGDVKVSGPGGHDSKSNTSFKFGVGGAYQLNKNVDLRAEWERYHLEAPGDTTGNVDMFSIGAIYRF